MALTRAETHKIAREQFEPLPKEWEGTFAQKLKDGNLPLGLTAQDLSSILDKDNGYDPEELSGEPEPYKLVTDKVVAEYTKCIAAYVNSAGGAPKIAVIENYDFLFESGPVGKAVKSGKWEVVDGILEGVGCGRQEIAKLDYVFMPLHGRFQTHWMLLGLAPKQNFAFYIDPCYGTKHIRQVDFRHFQALTQHIFPNPTEPWPILGYMSGRRWAEDPNSERMSPHQEDGYNCAVFLCTNALNMAFGYPVDCYAQEDLDMYKRPRMAAELITGGFIKPFDYQLLDIPSQRIVYPSPMTPPQTPAKGADSGAAGAAGPSGLPTPSATPAAPRDASTRPGTPPTLGAMVRKRTYSNSSLAEPTKVTACADEDHNPPQFRTQSPSKEPPFQIKPFVWPVQKRVFDDLTTKRALIAECRKRDLKIYSWWAKQDVEIFRLWMENEVVGRLKEEEIKEQEISQRKDATIESVQPGPEMPSPSWDRARYAKWIATGVAPEMPSPSWDKEKYAMWIEKEDARVGAFTW